MSNIAIKGATTGTGTFTIESPATNTDRTLTLPDEAGTVLTSGTPLSSFPTGFANGITLADQWRLNASIANPSGVISTNWEQTDTDGFRNLGSSLSEASGIFSFPETGLYFIYLQANADALASGDGTATLFLETTLDNSSYSTASIARLGGPTGGASSSDGASTVFIFDVTNTSLCKFRIQAGSWTSGSLTGATDYTRTNVTVFKIG